MRHAKELATPHTQCFLYSTYWFRPILSELLVAATEHLDKNRERAPSGPVKVAVSPQPHERQQSGVKVVSSIPTVIAWFPARWASKIAPFFLKDDAGLPQNVSEVSVQSVQSQSVQRPWPAIPVGTTIRRTTRTGPMGTKACMIDGWMRLRPYPSMTELRLSRAASSSYSRGQCQGLGCLQSELHEGTPQDYSPTVVAGRHSLPPQLAHGL